MFAGFKQEAFLSFYLCIVLLSLPLSPSLSLDDVLMSSPLCLVLHSSFSVLTDALICQTAAPFVHPNTLSPLPFGLRPLTCWNCYPWQRPQETPTTPGFTHSPGYQAQVHTCICERIMQLSGFKYIVIMPSCHSVTYVISNDKVDSEHFVCVLSFTAGGHRRRDFLLYS